MSFATFIFVNYIFLIFHGGFQSVSGSDTEQSCSFDLTKLAPANNVRNIKLTFDTKLKQEMNNLQESFSELMKTEFARQQTEFALLREELTLQRKEFGLLAETLNKQKEQLTNINEELRTLKASPEKSIKDAILAHKLQVEEFIKGQLGSVCVKGLFEQNQMLTEHFNSKLSYQVKVQEDLLKNVVKSIDSAQSSFNNWDANFNCTQQCGPIMDLPTSCEEAMQSNFSKNGAYLLRIDNSGLKPFYSYCKRIDNKIWTIIQRREDGSIDFNRNWNDYKHGFGNLYGEFWLGLERLHAMTTQHKQKLHIWMKSKNGTERYASYDHFLIGSEANKYNLTIDGHSGSAVDDLAYDTKNFHHNGMKFSTFDDCNDKHAKGTSCCAVTYKGGWWFNACYLSHLNGLYNSTTKYGIDWNDFDKKLVAVQMAIAPA